MDAIELLESQHREVETLLDQLAKAKGVAAKKKLFDLLVDSLAIHATTEERFYPTVRANKTGDVLLESGEEDIGIKRVLTDLLRINADDVTFEAKVKVLKEHVEHHFEEEEREIFPQVRKVFHARELEALGQEMKAEQDTFQNHSGPGSGLQETSGSRGRLPARSRLRSLDW